MFFLLTFSLLLIKKLNLYLYNKSCHYVECLINISVTFLGGKSLHPDASHVEEPVIGHYASQYSCLYLFSYCVTKNFEDIKTQISALSTTITCDIIPYSSHIFSSLVLNRFSYISL